MTPNCGPDIDFIHQIAMVCLGQEGRWRLIRGEALLRRNLSLGH